MGGFWGGGGECVEVILESLRRGGGGKRGIVKLLEVHLHLWLYKVTMPKSSPVICIDTN